ESDIRRLIEGAAPIEAQTHVRSFAHVDQPGGPEEHLLAPSSESDAPVPPDRSLQVGKPVLQVQTIDIGGRGRAWRGCQMIAELYECPEGIADVEIALEQKAMQIISRVPARREAEKRVAEVLDALPVFAAEVNIASRHDIERNEFERRPEVVRPIRAILVTRNVIIAQEVIGRRGVPRHLCANAARDEKKCRQHHYDRNGARGAGRHWWS